jgi:hypothetical protein
LAGERSWSRGSLGLADSPREGLRNSQGQAKILVPVGFLLSDQYLPSLDRTLIFLGSSTFHLSQVTSPLCCGERQGGSDTANQQSPFPGWSPIG